MIEFIKRHYKNIALIIGAIFIIYIFIENKRLKQTIISKESIESAVNDTIKQYKNKEGNWIAEKQTIQSSIKELLASNDKRLEEMQNLIKKERAHSAIIFDSKTKILDTSNTLAYLNYQIDSLQKLIDESDTDKYQLNDVTFKSSLKNDWYKADVSSSLKFTTIDLEVYNKYKITNSYLTQGFFKPEKAITKIENLNPFSKTENSISFEEITNYKWDLIFGGGFGYIPNYGFGFSGGLFIGKSIKRF